MIIQGALANVHGSVSTDVFLRFLAEKVPNGHYFMVQPPPGIAMTAAIDWRIVLDDAAAIAALAMALWSGYESFMQHLQGQDPLSSAGIVVQMKNEKGEFDQFIIGKEIREKEVLMHRMKESTRTLSSKNIVGALHREIEETERSGYWEKI